MEPPNEIYRLRDLTWLMGVGKLHSPRHHRAVECAGIVSVKGVLHHPSGNAMLKPETRDTILLAIVKARSWIDDLVSGRVQSFAEIAQHEGKVERHVRRLAPVAFTPPAMLAAIIAGPLQTISL